MGSDTEVHPNGIQSGNVEIIDQCGDVCFGVGLAHYMFDVPSHGNCCKGSLLQLL
jgi:hypothetical protein